MDEIKAERVSGLYGIWEYYVDSKKYKEWVSKRYTLVDSFESDKDYEDYFIFLEINEWIQKERSIWILFGEYHDSEDFIVSLLSEYYDTKTESQLKKIMEQIG